MSKAESLRITQRPPGLAAVALVGSALPVTIAGLAVVLFGERGDISSQLWRMVALPLTLLVGVSLGSIALVKSDGSGGRFAAATAIVIGGLAGVLLFYSFFLNPN